jgi:hypothetical protein
MARAIATAEVKIAAEDMRPEGESYDGGVWDRIGGIGGEGGGGMNQC